MCIISFNWACWTLYKYLIKIFLLFWWENGLKDMRYFQFQWACLNFPLSSLFTPTYYNDLGIALTCTQVYICLCLFFSKKCNVMKIKSIFKGPLPSFCRLVILTSSCYNLFFYSFSVNTKVISGCNYRIPGNSFLHTTQQNFPKTCNKYELISL